MLAAGASERFGGFPKALLRVGAEAALDRVIRLCLDVSSPPIRVVTAPGSRTGEAAKGLPEVELVENPSWEAGRTGSLQLGLDALPPSSTVLVWPVDHPLVEAMTLRALLDAAVGDPMATWLIPSWKGRGGHPILFTPEARPYVDALAPQRALHDVLTQLGVGVRRVPVSDPGVLDNLDTPGAYRRALENWADRGGPR